MNMEELRLMVKSDLVMDKTELDIESMKTPQIHNKYLVMYSDEKLILGKLESDLNILKRDKWLYYTGKMSPEQLEDRGWDTFDLNILKTDIDKFLGGDEDLIKLANR